MKQVYSTYFVETHEYNPDSNILDLAEYFKYDSGVHDVPSRSDIEPMSHHTVLSLCVF